MGKTVAVDAIPTNETFKFKGVKAPERENRRRRTLDVFNDMSVYGMFVRCFFSHIIADYRVVVIIITHEVCCPTVARPLRIWD